MYGAPFTRNELLDVIQTVEVLLVAVLDADIFDLEFLGIKASFKAHRSQLFLHGLNVFDLVALVHLIFTFPQPDICSH